MENQFKSSPSLREPQFVCFDEEGFYATNQYGSGQTKWEGFIQITETDEDLLLFPESKFAQFVPKRFFKAEQLNKIRELAKRKLGDKAKF